MALPHLSFAPGKFLGFRGCRGDVAHMLREGPAYGTCA